MVQLNPKTTPVLSDPEGYSNWRADLEIWEMFTDLEKKKRGPAVFLSLTGQARECVRALGAEEIGKETGVKSIIEQLDKIFLKYSDTRVYVAFKKLFNYRRMSGVTITDFVVEFDQLYHKLAQFDMKSTDGVLAFFLLSAANVSEENEKLARATCKKLTYEVMKTTILKLLVTLQVKMKQVLQL